MSSFKEQAIERLGKEYKNVAGVKETAMRDAVRRQLEAFCEQDEEFAQAVVQGGSFAACMKTVASGVGTSISDIDAYTKAVRFYFPGAMVRAQITVDLIGAVAKGEPASEQAADTAPAKDSGKPAGLLLDLAEFL